MKKILFYLKKIKQKLQLLRNYLYDYSRMTACSSAVHWGDNREKLRSLIIIRYHGIEKGLSLESPREGFGVNRVHNLLGLLKDYVRLYGFDYTCASAAESLLAYRQFNSKSGSFAPALESQIADLENRLAEYRKSNGDECQKGGLLTLTRLELEKAASLDFESFCRSRYSVRQFSDKPADLEIVKDAIRIAQKTPSVCNRQPGRVWVVQEEEKVKTILRIGGGAIGFEDQIKMLLVVTSDLSCFQAAGERYQCWIDGGMFLMSLMYALHSKGLVSCCMNWSKEHEDDKRLRDYMELPLSESVIALLGVGCPRDEFAVACSSRKPLDEVIRYY